MSHLIENTKDNGVRKMKKLSKLIQLIYQVLMLLLLFHFLSMGGSTLMYGGALAIKFGVSVMALVGSAFSFVLPTVRHRLLRDTQIGISSYLTQLCVILIMILMLSSATSTVAIEVLQSQKIFQLLTYGFLMYAVLGPVAQIGMMFSSLKSVEYRNPMTIFRQHFQKNRI